MANDDVVRRSAWHRERILRRSQRGGSIDVPLSFRQNVPTSKHSTGGSHAALAVEAERRKACGCALEWWAHRLRFLYKALANLRVILMGGKGDFLKQTGRNLSITPHFAFCLLHFELQLARNEFPLFLLDLHARFGVQNALANP